MMSIPRSFSVFCWLNSRNKVKRSITNSIFRYFSSSQEDPCYARDTLPPVGQPTAYTHPHLIKPGEVVPGLTLEEFQGRRSRLLESVEAHSPKHDLHVVVVPASPKKYMTEKIPYVFRQDSDFMYLSGCLEPESCLVLTSHRRQHEAVLFLRSKDTHAELWDGPRTGPDRVVDLFGVDRGLPIGELGTYLRGMLKTESSNYVWYDYIGGVNNSIYSLLKETLPYDYPLDSPRSLIHQLRVRKSPSEQALMRKTCKTGCEAMIRTMKVTKPGMSEAQLFAKVDYESRMLGANFLAYPPVVASGPRANIIHYINNNQIIEDGHMLLMDAGCEQHSYSSDITRTWPVSGRWKPEQRALYEVLQRVQLQLIEELSERRSLNNLFHLMCRSLGRGLEELGMIKTSCRSSDEIGKVGYSFCPHHVSHYLGMDVHDSASVTRDIELEPGMVFTVEPGIYVNSRNSMANPLYHGMGMRIEDDVLVTDTGIEILTADCPKHPDDIERIVGVDAVD